MPIISFLAIALLRIVGFPQHFDKFEWVAWSLISCAFLYVGWAYWKDKDLPARSGDFKFEEGKNSTARALYVTMVVGIYAVVAIFA